MLSNLEQHFSSENLLHEIQHDNDDSSSSSDSDDGFQTLDANGMPEPPANPWSPEEVSATQTEFVFNLANEFWD